MKILNKIIIITICLTILISCSIKNKNLLKDDTQIYNEITTKTKNIISHELDLNKCLALALQNNLKIKINEIEKKIIGLDRKMAFSSFFPKVNYSYNYNTWNRQPQTKTGPDEYRAIQDKTIIDNGLQIQVPLFVPATWFIYSSYKHGEKISELVSYYTKQIISLQTVISYYKCLLIEESENYLLSQIKAAKSLLKEFEIKQKEGLLLDWQVEELKVYLMSKYTELQRLKRSRQTAGSNLLNVMGLSPIENINVKKDIFFKLSKDNLEDLILKALKNNLQLKIKFKAGEISQNNIKMALTNFLPVLNGFINISHTTNDFSKYAEKTMTGLSGFMSIFEGFKNIKEYKKARRKANSAFLDREDKMLNVILSVIETYNNVEDAKQMMELMKRNLEVETKKLENIKAQSEEGLINSTELLEAISRRDSANSNFIKTKYNLQISIAALYNAVGQNIYNSQVPRK